MGTTSRRWYRPLELVVVEPAFEVLDQRQHFFDEAMPFLGLLLNVDVARLPSASSHLRDFPDPDYPLFRLLLFKHAVLDTPASAAYLESKPAWSS